MKVKELIEALNKLPPKCEVVESVPNTYDVHGDIDNYFDDSVQKVEECFVSDRHNHLVYLSLSDEDFSPGELK